MCRWELMPDHSQEPVGHARKETGWLTNSWHLAQLLEGECANLTAGEELHRHVHLVNGTAKLSTAYPPKLVKAILKALKLEMRDCGELSIEEE